LCKTTGISKTRRQILLRFVGGSGGGGGDDDDGRATATCRRGM